jgi:heme A synthase
MRKVFFLIAAILAIVFVVAAIYFLIPGIYHPYISLNSKRGLVLVNAAKHPGVIYSAHRFYAGAAFVVALLLAFIALMARPRAQVAHA